MARLCADLTIDDVLLDPMIAALRRADGVEDAPFERLLRQTARQIATRAEGPLPPAHLCRRLLSAHPCATTSR